MGRSWRHDLAPHPCPVSMSGTAQLGPVLPTPRAHEVTNPDAVLPNPTRMRHRLDVIRTTASVLGVGRVEPAPRATDVSEKSQATSRCRARDRRSRLVRWFVHLRTGFLLYDVSYIR